MKDKSKRFAKKAAARKAAATIEIKVIVECRPQFRALRDEMRENIRKAESKHSNKYRHMCKREGENFIRWAIENGYKPDDLATMEQRTEAGRLYVAHLYSNGVPLRDRATGEIKLDVNGNAIYRKCAASTAEQYSKGVAVALGVPWVSLAAQKVSITDKTRSTGINKRAKVARMNAKNADAVRFCKMVGSRRGVTERLTGGDWCLSSTGQWGVVLMNDKHGKNNFHVIAPENLEAVASFFRGVAPGALVFPNGIDKHLDLHGIRAEHAREELARYTALCKDPAYRKALRAHLIARYTDPVFGNISYLSKLREGDVIGANKCLSSFVRYIDNRTPYILRGKNREAAIINGRPVEYDRLALTATSVFCVDHWKNSTTIAYYIVSS